MNENWKWITVRKALVSSANIVIWRKTKRKKQSGWHKILDIMKKKQSQEYNTSHKEIRNRYRLTKEKWLNGQCAEIERRNITDNADEQKTKRGNADNRERKNIQRWKEYIAGLIHKKRKKTCNTQNIEITRNIKVLKWNQQWSSWTRTKQQGKMESY